MIYFGCDYYPEQWSQWLAEGEARWETDAALMAEAGFNTVRLAEFAWGLLEPAQGQFDFGWLDRAIDVLGRHGLKIVLCTPTPAPPPWLLAAHPEIMQVDAYGRHLGPGTRREACANQPAYRERSRIIVEKIAARYADNPHVIGWQTDNEFGCHDTARCHCEICTDRFHHWLQERHGDLELLNQNWGTAFWGEFYLDWNQIPTPNASAAERNPSHILDFYRFSSDTWRAYHNEQIAILRRLCPNHFVTHNLMFFFPDLDAYDLSENLDFASWDNYHFHGATPALVAAAHDHIWGVMERNFWVMEQQAGQINWSVYNPLPEPNFVRLKTYQGIGHGADGIIYFRWRQALGGSEQYHSGVLDYAGRKTQSYAEIAQIGQELKELAPKLEGTVPSAEVAILLDFDSRWVLQNQPHNSLLRMDHANDFTLENPAVRMDREDEPDERYMTGRAWIAWPYLAAYIALWEANVPAAIVAPNTDLSRYKIVCAPFLNLLRPDVVENLRRFVKNGGTLILGPRAGVKDQDNKLFPIPQPGPLADLAGTTVRYMDSLAPERRNELRWSRAVTRMGRQSPIGLWAEILEPEEGTQVIATYTEGWYSGKAGITYKFHEEGGKVIYVGCMGGPMLYHALFGWLLPEHGIYALMPSMPGVEICARVHQDGRRILFLLNHTSKTQYLSLSAPTTDILSGEQFDRSIILQPGEVRVIEEKNR
ncbi:MAG: beta-galactosidase [Caldilineaceae bacterium]|nr:beta-galactosidase [Caldilineaceae bacterium]